MEDVVRGIHYLMQLNNDKGIDDIYNLGSSNTVRIIDIARRIQKELKDSFDYDCTIETNKLSTETNKVDPFIFSIKKIMHTGFRPDYGGKEIRSLLEQCKMKQQLVVH